MKHTPTFVVFGVLLAAAMTAHMGAAPDTGDNLLIAHVLNRLGYGPRPGDIERVQRIGVRQYVEQQLHPDGLVDSAVRSRLAGLTTLGLSSHEIASRFELPALQARRDLRQQATKAPPGPDQSPGIRQQGNADLQQANVPLLELSEQKILRAVYSDRQLEEVLTDFWFNHFNVDARKGPSRFLLTEYERDTIRPHVLGRFRDLLGATARSSAMLFYLDNWMSADPDGPNMDAIRPRAGGAPGGGLARRPLRRTRPPGPDMTQAQQRKNRPTGLNENYGRELLELHTLGVDGGYAQKDVTEVARAFTGWSIANPRLGGSFRFVPQFHDRGEKVVLGHHITAGGERDGDVVLDILAAHPSTARFLAAKLARRFISDTPPQALVDRAAARFRETDGDLRSVMVVLLTSPEFLSPTVFGAKVKTPFEFMVSALRATDAEISNARTIARSMQELGMPLYQCQPPTGYRDTADAWVNTGALVTRMNIALTLASGRLRGVALGHIAAPEQLIASGLSEVTRATIAKASSAPQAVALALGSPEFQRK